MYEKQKSISIQIIHDLVNKITSVCMLLSSDPNTEQLSSLRSIAFDMSDMLVMYRFILNENITFRDLQNLLRSREIKFHDLSSQVDENLLTICVGYIVADLGNIEEVLFCGNKAIVCYKRLGRAKDSNGITEYIKSRYSFQLTTDQKQTCIELT